MVFLFVSNITLDEIHGIIYSQNELNNGYLTTIQLVIILGYLIYRKTFTHSVYGTLALVPVASAASVLTVCAEESATDVTTVMSNTATTISGQMLSMLSSIAPIAGTVIAGVLAVTFGFKLIKRFMH